MSVFQVSNAPGEGGINDKVYAAAHRHRKSVRLVFRRPVAPLRVVRESAISVVPGVKQFFPFFGVINLMCNPPASDEHLGIRRDPP